MKAKPKTEAKKKAIAKVVKKQAKKKVEARAVKAEIVVHVDTAPQLPTETQLAEPMKDGKAMVLQATWLSERQLLRMTQRTPREHVYRRKGKGGGEFDYVTGSYCIKWLNFNFGWNWDWEVTSHGTNPKGTQIWVNGRLTVRGNKPGQVIVKTGFGRSDVKQLKAGGDLDYGNDLKSASTDALKKAASLLGFASDVYGKSEYKQESGQTPLPPAPPAGTMQLAEKVIDYSQPQYKCTNVVNGKTHGVSITKEQAEHSLKMTGSELCKAHELARKG